jgi:hypothetical protein
MTAPAPGGVRAVRALALTSSFFHRAIEGMTGHEPLSRASAFVVAAARNGAGIAHHVVLSAHVARPFRFPAYYPRERHPWLELLSEEHVRCSVDAPPAAGCAAALRDRIFVHPTLDLAVGHVSDEPAFAARLHAAGLALEPVDLLPEPVAEGEALRFEGHVLVPNTGGGGAADDANDVRLVPHAASGRLLARSGVQTFAATAPHVLEMGMCGGPVLRASDGGCAGVIEGVVPASPPGGEPPGGEPPGVESPRAKAARLLAGAAVMIDAAELRAFVRAVERQLR